MVYLDKSSRNTHAIDLQAVVDLAQRWPQPLRVVTVDAATHLYLIKAVAHAGGIASLTLPCVVVFVKGKAVVPPIMMGGDFEHEVVKRIAFAQQHSHHSQDSAVALGSIACPVPLAQNFSILVRVISNYVLYLKYSLKGAWQMRKRVVVFFGCVVFAAWCSGYAHSAASGTSSAGMSQLRRSVVNMLVYMRLVRNADLRG